MIKRDITETVYEYDKEGKLVKKTVIEKHEEENPNGVLNDHNNWWRYNEITCNDTNTTATLSKDHFTHTSNCNIQG